MRGAIPAFAANARPGSLGPAQIAYGPASSILTPANGSIGAYKFTLNPYLGCGFGCHYCYARFFAPSPELAQRWGEWVRVKENAASLIGRAALARDAARRLQPGDAIFMSSATDPYQPIEARLGLTRAVLEALLPHQPRLTVQTRSPIVRRDIDLLAQFAAVRVNLSVPTDDEAVRLRYEPHAPSIRARLATLEAVRGAGIRVGVMISPMLPMRDPVAFGHRIAALEAEEYAVTGFHRPGPQFGARTRLETLSLLREDGWTRKRFEAAREAIREGLGDRPLHTARRGFGPPMAEIRPGLRIASAGLPGDGFSRP